MADFAINRKATFEYEVLERYEAGLELLGTEVKSIRAGRANIAGSFVVIRGGEAYLLNADIAPFQTKNAPRDYDLSRSRRLLLKRSEIRELIGKTTTMGLTMIAFRLYAKGPRIKLEFGLCRRKRKYDKRETIRRRDDERSMARALRQHGDARPR